MMICLRLKQCSLGTVMVAIYSVGLLISWISIGVIAAWLGLGVPVSSWAMVILVTLPERRPIYFSALMGLVGVLMAIPMKLVHSMAAGIFAVMDYLLISLDKSFQ